LTASSFAAPCGNLSPRQASAVTSGKNGVLHQEFDQHSESYKQLEEASLRQARELGREIKYLNSSKISPEEEAQKIAARGWDPRRLICVLRRVDPCLVVRNPRNRATKKLEITYRNASASTGTTIRSIRLFGFLHARIQPGSVSVYVCSTATTGWPGPMTPAYGTTPR